VNTPGDVSAANAFQEDTQNDLRDVTRRVWLLRMVGAVLLVGGWAFTISHETGSFQFVLTTGVFAGLGAYAYLAAATSRGNAVRTERKLRHRLLMHNMELANMAMRDDLTQLFNRRYFFDRLEHELQSASGADRPVCVMLIDIDCLKAVNDTYGHRLGDRLLSSFGRLLLDRTRASDIAARIGGDEFALLLPDTTKEAATALIARIEQKLETTNLIDEEDVTLRASASFGLAGYPWCAATVDGLMQQADAAMYAAKRQRKCAASSNGSPPAEAETAAAFHAGETIAGS
jgi:diguanylate cyclase (GGDEF)-like protein